MSKSLPPDDEVWTSLGPLQPPSDAAAARAKPIFERWLNEVRGSASGSMPTAPSVAPVALGAPGWHVGSGRRYDLALTVALGPQQARLLMEQASAPPPAVLARASVAPTLRPAAGPATRTAVLPAVRAPMRPDKLGLLPMEDDPTAIAQDATFTPTGVHAVTDDATPTNARSTPARPPPGAATVRPPLKTGLKAAEVDHEVWQQTADTALLRTQSDGGMAFDIVIRDDVFADLSCTIAVNDGHATATFRVRDVNTRRLLEAEVGRLRAALEGRGLRVDRVEVTVDAAP